MQIRIMSGIKKWMRLEKMCELNGIRPLVERSRSGKGAHVWIFFKKAIPAATARNFGFLLLDKGSTSINLKSFHYYDRMYPSQDVASSIGNFNCIAITGQALKNGNSAFVDEVGMHILINGMLFSIKQESWE